jgi:ABC-type transporter Mla MlaB component
MLRITNIAEESKRILRLEGTLAGPWVQEVGQLCDELLAGGLALTLDCSGVSFVDSKGVALLQGLRASRVAIENCSPFLEWQLSEASIASAERGEG